MRHLDTPDHQDEGSTHIPIRYYHQSPGDDKQGQGGVDITKTLAEATAYSAMGLRAKHKWRSLRTLALSLHHASRIVRGHLLVQRHVPKCAKVAQFCTPKLSRSSIFATSFSTSVTEPGNLETARIFWHFLDSSHGSHVG